MRFTVIESPDVMVAVDDAKERWARFDDAWSVVPWVLSYDPTVGYPLKEGGSIRSFVFDGSWAHEMPTIDVVYEITLTQVIIQRVRFRNAGTSAGRA
jgi:hypothetical protein